LRILSLDPGKNVDPFAGVVLDVTPDKIIIKAARFWLHVPYPQVEDEIAKIYKILKCDRIVVESNAMGDHVIDSLKRNHSLPVYRIFTGSSKTNKPGILNKMDQLMWLNRKVQEKVVVWPNEEEDNKYTKELKRQWAIFGEYAKNRVEAPPGEHDDLVMALMLGTYYARHHIMRGDKSGIIHGDKQHNIREMGRSALKTVLPDGCLPIKDTRRSWAYPDEN
jgi:hypothetical protein